MSGITLIENKICSVNLVSPQELCQHPRITILVVGILSTIGAITLATLFFCGHITALDLLLPHPEHALFALFGVPVGLVCIAASILSIKHKTANQ